MTDETTETTPGEQVQTPPQQVPDGFIEKARYTGAIQKIETLTNSQKEINDQLAAKSSEIEQLNQRLAAAEASQTTLAGQKDSQIAELQTSIDSLTTEKTSLESFKMKADMAKELGRPDLLPLLEHLPNFDNPESLKAALSDFANFADGAASAREAQLRAGVIDTPATKPGATTPATPEAWLKHIEGLELGSQERQQATDRFGDWLEQNEKLGQ